MSTARSESDRTRPAAALAATVVALLLTAGCSGDTAGCGPAVTAEISQADLYGSYTGPHGVRLDLTLNGGTSVTFTVNDWPETDDPGILGQDGPSFDGSGIGKLLNAPGEDAEAGLAFDCLDTSVPVRRRRVASCVMDAGSAGAGTAKSVVDMDPPWW
ncbi:hypothetical protein [Streptomyces sp. NBC_00467]|uniref:hypothetical protein n=1 Tax=Streptomyces sp. NBC_00467 TaxID=2975752 RepID=UPI002E19D8FF